MKTIAPNIFVNDINLTIDFYRSLGFELIASVPEEGDFVWAMMKNGEVSFMFQTFESLGSELPNISREKGGSLLLYIQISGIFELYNRIKGKINILKDMEKTFYGATEFSILDPNGYVLTFAEDL